MITKWNELPMGKFLEIQKIDDEDEIQAALKVNAILADTTVEEIMKMPIADVAKMSKARAFLEKKPIMRITRRKYVLGNNTYIFDGRPTAITTAQFIDLQTLDKKDVISALAIFLVPEGKKYNDGYDLEDVKDDIKKYLSAEEGLSMTNFFTILLGLYYRRAIRKAKRILKKAKKAGIQTDKAEKAVETLEQLRQFTRG